MNIERILDQHRETGNVLFGIKYPANAVAHMQALFFISVTIDTVQYCIGGSINNGKVQFRECNHWLGAIPFWLF